MINIKDIDILKTIISKQDREIQNLKKMYIQQSKDIIKLKRQMELVK